MRKKSRKIEIIFVIVVLALSVMVETQSILPSKIDQSIRKTTINDTGRYVSDDTNFYESFINKNKGCSLTVNNVSQAVFTYNILKHQYNFVYFKLNFVNLSVYARRTVFAKSNWIWTYEGEGGAHQYLYIPQDFGYMSFGLLWAHTMKEGISVDIEKSGECKNLTIGNKDTDYLIGQALGNMTSEIASQYEIYNSSLWCYNKRTWISSSFLYELCRNSICTFQTIEYECCKFTFDYIKKTRIIQCHKEQYRYGALWWILPIIAGNVCFAFYPLLLTHIGLKFMKLSKTVKKERHISTSLVNETLDDSISERSDLRKSNYLQLKASNPVSVFSILFIPFFSFVYGGAKGSRTLRIWIIILPMCLTAAHVILDYIYAYEFTISAVQKGALVGYSALLAGVSEARKHFLYVFGGPVVTFSIYIIFGCLLIVFPSNLEDFLAIGITKRVKKFVFLTRMPIKLKEKLSGINVRHLKGCKKLHRLLIAQIFMLIHSRFWKQSLKLFYLRWKNIIFLMLHNKLQNLFIAIMLSALLLPLYIMFCVTELLLAVLYYLFPVVNCFFIVLNSFCIHYFECFHRRGFVVKCCKHIFFIPTLILFSISWYTYCLIFFDGFWFLCRIVMLTYSGIVAYPQLSYGYLVLVFMTLFYVAESINAFGESYRELLKLSLKACEIIQQKYGDDAEMDQNKLKSIQTKYGIKSDLFDLIIRRNLPRRNQLLITMLKLTSVIIVLIISVQLLVTFDKLKELSLVTHVFTVLFVCALPKIVKMMCFNKHKDMVQRKMKQKVLMTITEYIRNKMEVHSRHSSDEHCRLVVPNSGYESLSDSTTDTE